MTASKLLKRMLNTGNQRRNDSLRESHNRTYGISSDPLMQFTLVFASLIHDVDHVGLRNTELVAQRLPQSIIYKGRSVAEQNSLDVAWKVLMDDDFSQLRDCIYTNRNEFRRFRQLLVNAILSTDLDDIDSQKRRHARWEKAFDSQIDDNNNNNSNMERRGSNHMSTFQNDSCATVLYEHIMIAADWAHTIQHWQTYRKFHERMFCERLTAFLNGDEGSDPSATWYEDELAFFDNNVIPLAEKLRSCNVFGTTGDEFMRWAQQNRAEWATKGKSVVQHMRNNVLAQYDRRNAKERRRRGSVIG